MQKTKRYVNPGIILFLTLFSVFNFAGSIFPQQLKIIKIIDTNLFQLEDSTLIRLAGVEAPTKDIPGENMNGLAHKIIYYASNVFLRKKLDIVLTGHDPADSSVHLAIIKNHYDLGTVDYNKRYLEFGFAKFRDNVDDQYKSEYKKAEAEAILDKEGIWSLRLPEVQDTLDRKYSAAEIDYYSMKDSLNRIEYLRKHGPSPIVQVTFQTGSGILVGGIGSLLTGVVSGSLLNRGGEYGGLFAGLAGMAAGYVVFTPLGVFMAAKPYNPELSFSATLGFSSLCTLAGIGIALLGPQNHNNQLWIIPPLMPLLGSLTYVNLIAPNPVSDYYFSSEEQDFHRSFEKLAYKDIYNSQMQIRLNVFSIPL